MDSSPILMRPDIRISTDPRTRKNQESLEHILKNTSNFLMKRRERERSIRRAMMVMTITRKSPREKSKGTS